MIKKTFLISFVVFSIVIHSQSENTDFGAIYAGIPWFDNNGDVVSGHEAGIIKQDDTYFLFGEFKSNTTIVFNGFSCYSSKNLYDWTFESIALPVQDSGKLGPNRTGERPKVMKCPESGEYIMYMHTDDTKYKKGTVIKSANIKNINFSKGWELSNESYSDRRCNIQDASFTVPFQGSQIGLYGVARDDGGYAQVEIQDSNGKTIQSHTIEMYCKYPESSLKYLIPILPKGNYKFIVTVLGDHGNWYKKDSTKFGSTNDFVSIDKIIIK